MSGPLLMDVRVPEGATPGQSMLVQADTGQQVQIEIPSYAQPGSIIQVSVPQPGGGAPPGGGGDDDLARAIQASLAESGGGISQPAVDPKIEAATVEAISMGFEEEQVRRVQAGRSFTSTSVRASASASASASCTRARCGCRSLTRNVCVLAGAHRPSGCGRRRGAGARPRPGAELLELAAPGGGAGPGGRGAAGARAAVAVAAARDDGGGADGDCYARVAPHGRR